MRVCCELTRFATTLHTRSQPKVNLARYSTAWGTFLKFESSLRRVAKALFGTFTFVYDTHVHSSSRSVELGTSDQHRKCCIQHDCITLGLVFGTRTRLLSSFVLGRDRGGVKGPNSSEQTRL